MSKGSIGSLCPSVESRACAFSFDDFDSFSGRDLSIDSSPLLEKPREGEIVIRFGTGHVGEAPFEAAVLVHV